MAQDEADNLAQQIDLGRHVLDLAAGRLTSMGREVPLRPTSFAVLKYLAQRPGERVPTDELVEAVWPGVIGSDDHLVQSIGELRRVFGDTDGRFIVYSLEEGALLDPSAAAPERRHAPGVQPLRFRWMYGLIAPLVLALAFAVIWFVTARAPSEPATAAHPTIAILPFQDQSDDPALAVRADQFTREIIAALSRHTAFVVKTWEDVAIYKGVLAQPGEIARVLGVSFQLAGSIRFAEGQVRVSAQLVDVQGAVLWSARYVEPQAELPALQTRMAGEIVDALLAASHAAP